MENHPIPQDITGFQFKLIGDMTIKQFAYLGGGVGLAWLTLILPVTLFIKLPISLIFGLIGISLAFFPIEGRPMDLMITNFFKDLFRPTQFIYQKTGGQIYVPGHIKPHKTQVQSAVPSATASSLSGDRLKTYLDSLPKAPGNKLDQKEMVFFQSLQNMQNPAPGTSILPHFTPPHIFSAPAINQPTNPVEPNEPKEVKDESKAYQEKIKENEDKIKKELEEAKVNEEKKKNTASYNEAHQKVLELEKLLNESLFQKQELERKLMALEKKIEAQDKKVFQPSEGSPQKTEQVKTVPKGMEKTVGVPPPEYPNIITGIIKDPRGNPLNGVLIEIKDSEGNPVRAFKTNPLGQFASATPLSNGTYRIYFEDPKNQHKFDAIEFNAKGEIIMPIEIISVDAREELRKSLFN